MLQLPAEAPSLWTGISCLRLGVRDKFRRAGLYNGVPEGTLGQGVSREEKHLFCEQSSKSSWKSCEEMSRDNSTETLCTGKGPGWPSGVGGKAEGLLLVGRTETT